MTDVSADESRTATVEASLEGLIERLTVAEQTPRVRALRIEALRLRSIMANWRSIPPTPQVREAMLSRVLHVISAASDLKLAARPQATGTRPPPASIGPPPNEDIEQNGPPSFSDEETVVYDRSATPTPFARPPIQAVRPPPPGVSAPSNGSIHDEPTARPDAPSKADVRDIPPPPRGPTAAAASAATPPPPEPVADENDIDDVDDEETATGDDDVVEAVSEPVDEAPKVHAIVPRGIAGRRDDSILDPAWEPSIPWRAEGRGRGGWGGLSGAPALPAPPPTQVEVHLLDFPDKLDPRLVMIREPTSLRADAFRALRQRLTTTGDPKVIVVSSPHDGDGKSTVAANLALAYREVVRGGRVLLVEANARRPSLATIFGFDPPTCFFDQLADHKDSPGAPWVAVEQIAPLHVMAVDPSIKRPPTLDAVAFSLAMGKLTKAGYDYVVVDSSSIMESADVHLVLESVEGLLMSTRSGKTTQKAVKRALERLGPANVIGAVMLDVPPSSIV